MSNHSLLCAVLCIVHMFAPCPSIHAFTAINSLSASSCYSSSINKDCTSNCRPLREKSSDWSVGDDWNSFSSSSDAIDTSDIFNIDVTAKAAQELEQWMNGHNSTSTNAGEIQQLQNNGKVATSVDDDFTRNLIDLIQSETIDPNGPQLYDTTVTTKSMSSTTTVSSVDEQGREIAFLVRCNESPQELLIDGGRALPELSHEEKYNVSQLTTLQELSTDTTSSTSSSSSSSTSSEKYKPTDFLIKSVHTMFRTHAKTITSVNDKKVNTLDAKGVASWLAQSLDESVGPHDKRIAVIMSKYSTYGTGMLTQEQFMTIYLDAVMLGLDGDNKEKELRTKHVMKKLKMKVATVMDVWRDLNNHGIQPPIMTIRQELQAKIDAEHGAQKIQSGSDSMDECEIVGWDKIQDSTKSTTGSVSTKRSYQDVDLSSDLKTPKRIRDGEFGKIGDNHNFSFLGNLLTEILFPFQSFYR